MKKIIIYLVAFISVSGAFVVYSVFTNDNHSVSQSNVANITLIKDKVVANKIIYPTKLIGVNLLEKSIVIEVKFPDEGWKRLTGKEDEIMDATGYQVLKVEESLVIIRVFYPGFVPRHQKWEIAVYLAYCFFLSGLVIYFIRRTKDRIKGD